MTPMPEELYVTNRQDWRAWLKSNHAKVKEIWLIYFKKHTGRPRIPYDDAVEEALCYGWIDSTIRRLDEDRFAQKFTPRKSKSNWSELNKKRVQKLIRQGRMTKAGMVKVEAARKNGEWDKKPPAAMTFDFPIELAKALSGSKTARDFFDSLSPSFQKQYVGWIASARKPETRQRRAEEALRLLKKKQKLGMM
jgi:uncharacterized protein YdeI (YjbR/CyaY-like superfamily)